MKSVLLILLSAITMTAMAADRKAISYDVREVELVRGAKHADHLEFRIKKITTSTEIYFAAKDFGFDDSNDAANSLQEKFKLIQKKYPNQKITFFVNNKNELIPSENPFKVQFKNDRQISSDHTEIDKLQKQLLDKDEKIRELEYQLEIK